MLLQWLPWFWPAQAVGAVAIFAWLCSRKQPLQYRLAAPPAGHADRPKTARLSVFDAVVDTGVSNPFHNHTWSMNLYEKVKFSIMAVTLLPIKLAVIIGAVVAMGLSAKFVNHGTDQDKPLTGWRRKCVHFFGWMGRLTVLATGTWVTEEGQLAPREQAPIVLSNHISFIDSFYVTARALPMAVGAVEHMRTPILGDVTRALRVIPVDRNDKDNRRKVKETIERRTKALHEPWRQLLIFPEGTTSTGDSLIQFRLGAFQPGVAVQPVIVQQRSKNYDFSWVTAGPKMPMLLLRCVAQLVNHYHVQWLPPYTPSEEEKADPMLYMKNVRAYMCKHKPSLKATEFSFDDVKLQLAGEAMGIPPQSCNVEMPHVKSMFDITRADALALLPVWKAMASASPHCLLDYQHFIAAYDAPDDAVSRRLFALCDNNGAGQLSFREWLLSIALLKPDSEGRAAELREELLFKVADVDGDGVISADDLSAFAAIDSEAAAAAIATFATVGDALDESDFARYCEEKPAARDRFYKTFRIGCQLPASS